MGYSCDLTMKINKQTVLLIVLSIIAVASYIIFPQFERENFDTENVEEISTVLSDKSVTKLSLAKTVKEFKAMIIIKRMFLIKVLIELR